MDFKLLNLGNDNSNDTQTGGSYVQADSSLYDKDNEPIEKTYEEPEEVPDIQAPEIKEAPSPAVSEHNVIQEETYLQEPDSINSKEDEYTIEEIPVTEPIEDIVEVVEENTEESYDSIEGGPYSRVGGRPIREKKDDLILYGTTDVAKMIGMSTQAIRNYCDYFEDYLQIPRKESGHRSFTQKHVDKLRGLIEIKDKKNLTFEQLKEYLIQPESFDIIPESQKFEVAMDKMQELFENSLRSAMNYISDSNVKMLEEKDAATARVMTEVTEQLKKQDDTIQELLEVIKKDREAEQSEKDELLNKTIENLQVSIKERDAKIEELIRITEQQNSKITELETKKQKKFLGIFG